MHIMSFNTWSVLWWRGRALSYSTYKGAEVTFPVRTDLVSEPEDVEEEVQPGGAPEGPGGGGEEGEERRDRADTRLHLHTDRTGWTII